MFAFVLNCWSDVPAESRVHVWDRWGSYYWSSHGRTGCRDQIRGNAQRASGEILVPTLLLFAQLTVAWIAQWTHSTCNAFVHKTGMLRSLGYWISHWQVRLRTDGTSTAVCLCVSCMLFCCISPDQVPAWWCLDQDSFTPWAEWRTPTWTAGKTAHLCCMFNMAHTDSGQMSALCLSTGQWLLSEAPRIVTRRQQAPFRSFLRYSTSSLWKLSPCWCSNDLTHLSTCCSGGGVSPLQQVLSQAQQSRSHPLSGREGGRRPYCCVPLVTSARLQKLGNANRFYLFILSKGCPLQHVWTSGGLLCWHCRRHGER